MEPTPPPIPGSNPYQAPSVSVMRAAEPEGSGQLIPGGRSVVAGQGWGWIASAWSLFTAAPLIWIVNFVIFLVIYMLLSLIPFLGVLATSVLTFVFMGGMLIGADHLRRGESLTVEHLFAGFKQKTSQLLILGAIYLGVGLVLLLIMGALFAVMLGMSGFFAAMMTGDNEALGAQMAGMGAGFALKFLLVVLIVLAVSIPIMMAFWFAPALVIFHEVSPVDALVMSFKGCLKNIVPFLLYGIILFALAIIAVIPLGLGMLVLVPVIYASCYTAYRDIFVGDET